MTTEEKLTRLAALISAAQLARLEREYPRLATKDWGRRDVTASVHLGKKYARVDIGRSGRYMVDLATEEIFGIKAYGVMHRGHRYGTLDEVIGWNWGGYTAHQVKA